MFNQNAALDQGTDIPSFNGEFVQYAADNVDHNTRTLDWHNTFYGMGMIAVVTPATRFSRNVARRKITPEEISATGKVEIYPCGPRQVNVEIKYTRTWLLYERKTPLLSSTSCGRRLYCLATHAHYGME